MLKSGKRIVFLAFMLRAFCANATGMLPETPLLVISEADGVAQMGLSNTDDSPLLLYTTIVDLPDDKEPSVFALPPVIRVEPHARQVVRFLLEKTSMPLTVQHLKRVRFEGIPSLPSAESKNESRIRVTVRQDLPVVISPKGLEQDPEPWKKLHFSLIEGKLVVSNPSAFVIRLSQEVGLLPSVERVKLFARAYVLPGETVTLALPEGTDINAMKGVRLFPASPYGFDVGSYDAPLSQ